MRSSADHGTTATRRLFGLPGLALVVLLVVVPLLSLASRAVTSDALFDVWSKPGISSAVVFTVWQTIVSTALTLLIGLIPAWAFSRHSFALRRVALAAVTVPFVLPTVVVGAAFLQLLPDGWNRGWLAVIVAHVYFNVAVVVRTVAPAWALLDPRLEDAARTLGASRLRVFSTITLPHLRHALLSAAAIVGFMCFTSYGVVRLLGGGRATMEVEIYRRAMLFGDVSGSTALALGQLLILAACLTLWSRRDPTAVSRVRSHERRNPWAALVAWVTVTITTVPLVSLILASFRNRGQWTVAGWNVLIGRQRVVGLDIDLAATVVRSLVFAGIATMVAVPIGLLAVHASRNSAGMERIMMIPLGTSAVAVALGILITYDVSPIDFRASWWLIPLVHSVVALPFVVRTISPVRSRIPDDLRLAAATLGASPVRTWLTVDRPLLMTAISTAAGLSAALSIGEFGATSLMSRRNTDTLPVAVERLLSRTGDLARLSGQSAAVVLLAVAITALLVLGRFDDLGSPGMGARS